MENYSIRRRRGRYKVVYLTIVLFLVLESCEAFDIRSCEQSLGLESGDIADAALTASSSYVANVGPHSARLRIEKAGGGWCPKAQIEKDVKEYLEVDLGTVHVVSGIATQGRYDRGRGQEYAEEYYVEYWRPRIGVWKEYVRWDQKKIFAGNSDTITVVGHNFTPAIHASKIRIIPYSLHRRTVCLRLELYGCEDDSGVISYSVPIGTGSEEDLAETTYDGTNKGEVLVGGLGRLTDGQVGGDYFTLDISYGRGSGWVAWRNSTSPAKYVEIIFEFDHNRNFSKIDIFTNNYYSRQAQMFRRSSTSFSIGGKHFNSEPIVAYHKQDRSHENARNVTILIPGGRVGKFVRIRLYFAAEWIMLGEVYFTSDIIYYTIDGEKDHYPVDEIVDNGGDSDDNDQKTEVIDADGTNFEVVIGVLSALVLLLVLVFIIVLVINARQKYAAEGSGSLLRNTFTMKINMKDLLMNLTPNNNSPPNEQASASTQARPTRPSDQPIANKVAGPSGRRVTKHSYVTELSPDSPEGRTVVSIANDDCGFIPNIPAESLHLRQGAYDRHMSALHHIYAPIQEGPKITHPVLENHKLKHDSVDISNPIDYYPEGDFAPSYPTGVKTNTRPSTHLKKHAHKTKEKQKTDNVKSRCKTTIPTIKEKGCDWGTWNIVPSSEGSYNYIEGEINPIPMYCLILHAHLGMSHSGEVSIYRTEGIEAIIPDAPKHVAVRATRASHARCVREMRALVALDHVALCTVLGVATGASPPLTVIEHSEAGDLRQLLARAGSDRVIGLPLLIYICVQICSAMKYLEKKNMVHRDLAARNCIVFPGNRVKISDIASCSPLYKNDYCTVSGERPIPVRWLSWESLLLERYTCKSVVWSYAVTVWEILNHCTQVPYDILTIEQVVEHAEHLYYGGDTKEILPMPDICPPELYQVLIECWKREEECRPTFQELYHFMITTFKHYVPIEYSI